MVVIQKQFLSVLVTGANGFVGRSLCADLRRNGYLVTGAVRSASASSNEVQSPTLAADSDWSTLLAGKDLVVHTAARVHVMNEIANDPLTAFRAVNVAGTLALAQQAAAAGVKRFVFISSIKVNGEMTLPGQPFTEIVAMPPTDPYGLSKYEAEVGLLALSEKSGMDVVIIRPPLIYGEGVKGNFATMLEMLAKGYPLPLGAIHNKRSLVSLENLIDLITTCITHPAAANEVFLVSDDNDLSTSELLNILASAIGKTTHFWPVPECILRLGASLLGKKAISQRLFDSLQVDITKAKRMLNWVPPVSVDDGLKYCVENFQRNKLID